MSAGMGEAGSKGGSLPEVPAERDHPNVRVAGLRAAFKRLGKVPSVLPSSIEHELVRPAPRAEGPRQLAVQLG